MTSKQLPAKGTAFAVPLEDGRFGACRVIRRASSREAKEHGLDCILVACSAWIGDVVPEVQDSALRSILYLTHHSWDNEPQLLWISEPPPDDFIEIGTVKSSWKDRWIKCSVFGTWYSARIQPLAQWRWDNERDSVLSEDKPKEEENLRRSRNEQQDREAYLARITLEELCEHQFFSNWTSYPPESAILASRQIMSDTVRNLIDLGSNAPESKRMSVLQACIERFNAIDADMEHFIETG